jgi:hypothetical protein
VTDQKIARAYPVLILTSRYWFEAIVLIALFLAKVSAVSALTPSDK